MERGGVLAGTALPWRGVSHNDAVRRIRDGIEVNGIGQRVAYHMYRSRLGDLQDMDVSQVVRVPADTVLHLYDPLRPGQLRAAAGPRRRW